MEQAGQVGRTPSAEGPRRIAVVGGGIAGLVAARDLARAGFDVEVSERGERLGGAVALHRLAGVDLDAGAEAFANRSDTVAALLRELGLEASIVTPYRSPAWLQLPDLAAPIPATGILGIPGDPSAEDVRAVLGPVGSARAAEDLELPLGRWAERQPGNAAGISVADLVRDRMGDAVLERLVTPIVAGVHSVDPEALDVETAAPGLFDAMLAHGSLARGVAAMRAKAPAGAAVSSLRGGMHTLISALVSDLEAHGGRVRLNAPVRDLGAVDADRIVLAVDAPAAAALLQTHPGLGSAAQKLAAATDPSSHGVALVTLVLDHQGLDVRPRGTGVLVAPGCARESGIAAKAMTHASAKWEWLREALPAGHHVLRLSYGRVGAAAGLADRVSATSSDEELLRVARTDAERLLDVEVPPESVRDADVVRWRHALPQSGPGHAERIAAVRAAVREPDEGPEVSLIGTWFSGTGLVRVISEARAVAAEISATAG